MIAILWLEEKHTLTDTALFSSSFRQACTTPTILNDRSSLCPRLHADPKLNPVTTTEWSLVNDTAERVP